MIAIVDCGIGNICSLQNALSYLGAEAFVASKPEDVENCDALILPGVGAFDSAMLALQQREMLSAIKDSVVTGRPILGICLGFQLLCERSEEGNLAGLQFVSGSVKHFRTLGCREKIPHVGFNSISSLQGESKFLELTAGKDFYFVHSYALEVLPETTQPFSGAYCNYAGVRFIAAFQLGNVYATQFHPEKSGEAGLALLSGFISCSRNA